MQSRYGVVVNKELVSVVRGFDVAVNDVIERMRQFKKGRFQEVQEQCDVAIGLFKSAVESYREFGGACGGELSDGRGYLTTYDIHRISEDDDLSTFAKGNPFEDYSREGAH